ncbi:MAG TPA: flagellar basal-body MS-ring/collar protein FliF [Candidatus Aquicultor sp.]|jgi:flagellar M-ring protein FliF
MATPAATLEKAQVGWSKLEINQKMIIVITVVLFVVALVSLVYWVSRPSYGVLFSNLSPEDASSIVTKLQEQKIAYRLNGSSIIEVPQDKVYETRISLAGQGLPQGGTVGFEIFDNASFGMSDFQQKVNYRRALEGELARTISQINEVEGTRVHIVIPESSLYTDQQNPATASVIIKPKAGIKLQGGQVQGIVNLVARSVEGLKPENVTLVDTDGNVLSDGQGDSAEAIASGYTKTQLQAKQLYESSLEKSIGSMLGKVLGSESNAVVRVSASLDFTSKETSTKRVEQGDNPVIMSQQSSTEKFTGPGSPPGGVAGVTGQTSGSTSTNTQASTTYPATTQSTQSNNYSRKETTTNYKPTEVEEHEVKPPGEVKKLSVAVVVNNDGTKPIQNKTIEGLVSAAAGLDKTRGDVLTVSSVPFDTAWVKKEEKAMADAQKQDLYANIAKYALVAVLLIVALFVVRKVLSGMQSSGHRQENFIGQPISQLSVSGLTAAEFDDITIDSDLTPEKKKEMAIQQRKRQLAREELQNLAKERPQDVAQLLKLWLNT